MKDILDMLKQYPNVKTFSTKGDEFMVEFYPPEPKFESQKDFKTNDIMPTDEQMMFFSTPTFDEMIPEEK